MSCSELHQALLAAVIIFIFIVSMQYVDLRYQEQISVRHILVNWHGTDTYSFANKYFQEVELSYHCVIPVGLEEAPVQFMFLSRFGARETQIWSTGLEHSL